MSARNLPMLIPKPTPPAPDAGRWAVVTQVSPLRIKLDGESTALPFTPDALTPGLEVNDRVWVQVYRRRLVIVGLASPTTRAYTPAFTSSGTTPVLGTGGVQSGNWIRDPVTGFVTVSATIRFGTSGNSPGSGNYRVDLPHAVSSTMQPNAGTHGLAGIIGQGWARDNSALAQIGTFFVFMFSLTGGTGGVGQVQFAMTNTNGNMTSSTPLTWDTQDGFSFTARYRPA